MSGGEKRWEAGQDAFIPVRIVGKFDEQAVWIRFKRMPDDVLHQVAVHQSTLHSLPELPLTPEWQMNPRLRDIIEAARAICHSPGQTAPGPAILHHVIHFFYRLRVLHDALAAYDAAMRNSHER